MTKMIRSAVAALGSLAAFAPSSQPVRYPHGSEWEALRSDWAKIGGDMHTVIERNHGKVKKQTGTARSSAA